MKKPCNASLLGPCKIDFQQQFCETCGLYILELSEWPHVPEEEQLRLRQLGLLRHNLGVVREDGAEKQSSG